MLLDELITKAGQGDASAQYDLGECYWDGSNGAEQSYEKAIEYYEKAADQGNIDAIYSLGYCYATGTGIEKNVERAEQLLTYAVDNGSVIAAAKMGSFYYWGDFFPEDRAKGYRYLKYAADNGDAHSMAVVGDIYLSGYGAYEGWGPAKDEELGRQYIERACEKKDSYALFKAGTNYCGGYDGYPEDNVKGTQYLKEAAELGHNYAQLSYAIKCWNGDGVPQSPSEYAKWMRESALNGNEEAIIRWAWTRFTGVVDGIRCQTEEELNECRNLLEQALANGDDFMLHNKEFMDEIYAEEQRIGRKMTLVDFYGTSDSQPSRSNNSASSGSSSGGCYIATAVYGSYDCPQVWTLRRYRDDKLSLSRLGRLFIKTYYAVSPKLVKTAGDTKIFQRFFRSRLDKIVDGLNRKGYDDTPYYDR